MSLKNIIKKFTSKNNATNEKKCSYHCASFSQKDGEEPVLFINGERVEPTKKNIEKAFGSSPIAGRLCTGFGMLNPMYMQRDLINSADAVFGGPVYSGELKELEGPLTEEVAESLINAEEFPFEEDEDLLRELNEVEEDKKLNEMLDQYFTEETPEIKRTDDVEFESLSRFLEDPVNILFKDDECLTDFFCKPTTASRVAQHLQRCPKAKSKIGFWTVTDKNGKPKTYTTTITISED